MPPITETRLLGLVLDALEEVAAAAHVGPVKRTWALRLVLAFLASRARHGSSVPRWAVRPFLAGARAPAAAGQMGERQCGAQRHLSGGRREAGPPARHSIRAAGGRRL